MRRVFWHAVAGLGAGLAGSFGVGLVAGGRRPLEQTLAVGVLVCAPLCGLVVALVASAARTLRGAVNAVVLMSLVTGALSSQVCLAIVRAGGLADPLRSTDLFFAVLWSSFFSAFTGSTPGLFLVLPLILGVGAARHAAELPAGTRGASRGIACVVAVTAGVATLVTVVVSHDPVYQTLLQGGCALAALWCIAHALRDVALFARLGRIARGLGRGYLATAAPAEPPLPETLLIAAPGEPVLSTEVVRVSEQSNGPFRSASEEPHGLPVLRLNAEPRGARRALAAGIAVQLALAVALGALVVRMETRAAAEPIPIPTSAPTTTVTAVDLPMRLQRALEESGRQGQPVSPIVRTNLPAGESREMPVTLYAGHCYFIIGTGSASLPEIEMTITDPDGNEAARNEIALRQLLETCPTTTGPHSVEVRAVRGSGEFAVRVFETNAS